MQKKIVKIIIDDIVKPKKGESILIISDTVKEYLAQPLFDYCVSKGNLCDLIVMLPTQADGQEPSEAVALACTQADIILALTKWSITHTKPLQKAKKKGAKVVTFPAVTGEILERCVPVDYKKIKKLTLKLEELLTDKKGIHLSSENGTDLLISTQGFSANPQYGEARYGVHMNLPDGECSVGIKNANGLLVVGGSMSPDQESKWGKIGLIKKPIKLKIKDCFVTDIKGGKEAKVLSKILKAHGKPAYKIAELGIGVNPEAKIGGNVTEDEKVLGTIHIALGNDTGLGGSNYSRIHLDGVLENPTLEINGGLILKSGKMLL